MFTKVLAGLYTEKEEGGNSFSLSTLRETKPISPSKEMNASDVLAASSNRGGVKGAARHPKKYCSF